MMELRKLVIILNVVAFCWSSPIEIEVNDDFKEIDNELDYQDGIATGEVCETEECKLIAKAYSETMNRSVNPCDDFYEYTCGNRKTRNDLIHDRVMMSRFKIFQSIVERDMKELLETESDHDEFEHIRKAKKWYQSCMNESARETRGIKTLEYLAFATGGWPMVVNFDEWNENEYSWQAVDEYYAGITGQYAFFKISLNRLQKADGYRRYIIINQQQLPLTSVLPLNNRNYTGHDLIIYRNLLRRVARLFIRRNGQNVSDVQLTKDIDDMIELEKRLYETKYNDIEYATLDSVNFYGSSQISYGQLDDLVQNGDESESIKIDWKDIISKMFKVADLQVDDNAIIISPRPSFLNSLPKLLGHFSKRTIVNYIHWRIMSQYLPLTNNEANHIYLKFMKNKFGLLEEAPRWRTCIKEMGMHHAVGYELVKKYFRNDTAQAAETMAANMKKSLENLIEHSNWLTSLAKKSLRAKLRAMKTLFGFPDWYDQKNLIEAYYKDLTINDDYVENLLRFSRHSKIFEIKYFASDANISKWAMDPMVVNAVHLYALNTVNIPAVDFQYPLFGKNVPEYINYGITGNLLGHEMGHGFDVTGIQIMADDKISHLSYSMLKTYDDRVKCFIDQFDRYFKKERLELEHVTLPPNDSAELNIRTKRYSAVRKRSRGSVTKAENIADALGIETAFNAYIDVKKKNNAGRELKLPGFEKFTDEQMFFVSFAEMWCEVATPQYTQQRTRSVDGHSPGRFRVLGGVSNSKSFAKAFSCPPGSPMNPHVKCNIWKKPESIPEENSVIVNVLDELP